MSVGQLTVDASARVQLAEVLTASLALERAAVKLLADIVPAGGDAAQGESPGGGGKRRGSQASQKAKSTAAGALADPAHCTVRRILSNRAR